MECAVSSLYKLNIGCSRLTEFYIQSWLANVLETCHYVKLLYCPSKNLFLFFFLQLACRHSEQTLIHVVKQTAHSYGFDLAFRINN